MIIPKAPEGYATVNPFIITRDADGLINFLKQVFPTVERPQARTIDDDGLLLHAELVIGDTTVMLAERKPDWPYTPSLLQVYVADVSATLETARQLGATVITEPTEFFGDTFSRIRDSWGNLWWIYSHEGQEAELTSGQEAELISGQEAGWASGPDAELTSGQQAGWANDASGSGSDDWDKTSLGLTYIHDTLLTAMQTLHDPGDMERRAANC
jgi:PhnB protein